MAKRSYKTATARLDEELIRKAGIIAAIRGVSAPEYLSGVLKPIIERDYRDALEKESLRKRVDGGEG